MNNSYFLRQTTDFSRCVVDYDHIIGGIDNALLRYRKHDDDNHDDNCINNFNNLIRNVIQTNKDTKLKIGGYAMNNTEALDYIKEHTDYELSTEQLNIIQHTDKPLSVVACAGSGKTTTIELKVLYEALSEQTKPNDAICITFSKRGQLDMVKRYDELLEITHCQELSSPKFSTFHALFYQLLRLVTPYHIDVTSMSQHKGDLSKSVNYKLSSNTDVSEAISLMANVRGELINTLKSTDGINPKDPTDDDNVMRVTSRKNTSEFNEYEYDTVMKKYNMVKRIQDKIDFDDMQTELLSILEADDDKAKHVIQYFRSQYSRIYIDEYQDISPLQFEIMNYLIEDWS